MRIIPALLTDKKDELRDMLETCERFTDYAQVDIMDGEFVPSSSVTMEDISSFISPLACEAHLMVNDPLSWIKPFKRFGAEKIIFHFEAPADPEEVIAEIRAEGLAAGIAINPGTGLDSILGLIDKLDSVLFMSVVPGFYGSPFVSEVMDKISKFKKRFPLKSAGIDGGVKLANVRAIAELGVEDICVGSALMKAEDPVRAYRKLIGAANG